MGLGGPADYLLVIKDEAGLSEAVAWARKHEVPVLIIGGGSNIVWRDEGYKGLILVNQIPGFELAEDETGAILTAGAGESWDSVVERSVAAGLTGIEALSLIPGTAGGTPVQNVGAYGQEIADTLVEVRAYDMQTREFTIIAGADCAFAYRNSRFKTKDRGRYLITGLSLRLKRGNPQPPFYGSVQAYFDKHQVTSPAPRDLRAAVVHIRSNKLPDPAEVRNTGSFFGNPIISNDDFWKLQEQFEDIPSWPAGTGMVKLSAAWLIEQAGFKDYHDPTTGMATWPTQPLVLVNENAKSTADLLQFKQKIVEVVQSRFNVTLVQEPELLP